MISCLSVLRLRARRVAWADTHFRAPGGPVVPLAAAAVIVWLLGTLAWRELFATLALIAASAAAYGGLEWRRGRRTSRSS